MAKSYIPIYRAKSAEFEALANASKDHLKRTLPLFEIPRITQKTSELKKFSGCTALTCAYLTDIAQSIAKIRKGGSVMVDISQWDPASLTETGEHVLPYLYKLLGTFGARTIPVIGFDSWESSTYRAAMCNVEIPENGYVCIRLDSHAIEDAEDPLYLDERVEEILEGLGIDPIQCAVILDFGDLTSQALADVLNQADGIIQVLAPKKFRGFITTGCSLPATIDGAVKEHDSTGKVVRKEMLLWQSLRSQYPNIVLRYGDYGVRGPHSVDDVIAPDANGKIRHTIAQNFYVLRGHSMRKGDKGGQMYKLADTLVNSPYFMGAGFSWGDSQIALRSKALHDPSVKIGPGGHATWIAIDTNHHLAYAIGEVDEFEAKTAIAAATTNKNSELKGT